MKIQLPEKVNRIITIIHKNMALRHMQSAAASGILFLGRVPGDWDITTSAAPEETKSFILPELFDTRESSMERFTVLFKMEKDLK